MHQVSGPFMSGTGISNSDSPVQKDNAKAEAVRPVCVCQKESERERVRERKYLCVCVCVCLCVRTGMRRTIRLGLVCVHVRMGVCVYGRESECVCFWPDWHAVKRYG